VTLSLSSLPVPCPAIPFAALLAAAVEAQPREQNWARVKASRSREQFRFACKISQRLC
jgi:hypothetical protein